MKIITTKCPFCPQELEQDSEKLYWHIKIHNATIEGIKQPEVNPEKTIIWGATADKEMNWEEANKWCKEQGGRLPTRAELLQAFDDNIGDFTPVYHWSASTYVDSPSIAWYVSFYNGYVSSTTKSYLYRVRCVRE